MVVKLIGAQEDKKIVPMLASVPNAVVEFFDDEINFQNSFSPVPNIKNNTSLVFLLVKELPIASFNSIVLKKASTTKIVINMRDRNIPTFNISILDINTEEKADIIKKIIMTSKPSSPKLEWHGWAI